ncbi:MAG: hypothetical protein PW791_07680 [Neorhizobium sp.]|nr:hypothetical protein [Neorhizobium sp.]
MAENKKLEPFVAGSKDQAVSGGTEPPGGDDLETRVTRLEEDMREIKGGLKVLLQSSAEIKGKMDGRPSAFDVGQLKGRLDALPTAGKLATMLGVAPALIAILNTWTSIKTAILG